MPYLVSIRGVNFYTSHVASGSILNERFVLTNAAALEMAGRLQIDANTQRTWDFTESTYWADETFIHPEYDAETHQNDIALLHVDSPIVFSVRVQPIALSEEWLTNQDAAFAGFGFSESSSNIGQPLAVVEAGIVDNAACQLSLGAPNSNLVFDNKVCAYPTEARVNCFNDNGAPLVINNQVVAVNSWSISCAHNAPIVSERVSSHLYFIRQYVN